MAETEQKKRVLWVAAKAPPKESWAAVELYFERAVDAEEALRQLKGGEEFDCVVVDHDNGIVSPPRLREIALLPRTPSAFIVVANRGDEHCIRAPLISSGVKEVIKKPLRGEDLVGLIEKYQSAKIPLTSSPLCQTRESS